MLIAITRGFIMLVVLLIALIAVKIIESIVEDRKRTRRNEAAKNDMSYKGTNKESRNDFVE